MIGQPVAVTAVQLIQVKASGNLSTAKGAVLTNGDDGGVVDAGVSNFDHNVRLAQGSDIDPGLLHLQAFAKDAEASGHLPTLKAILAHLAMCVGGRDEINVHLKVVVNAHRGILSLVSYNVRLAEGSDIPGR